MSFSQTAFAHFLSLCHALVWQFLQYFKHFCFLLCLLWWSAISNFWCYYHNCLGAPRTVCIQTGKLVSWVLWLTHSPAVSHLLLHSSPYCLRQISINIRPINNPIVAPKCLSESCTSLTLNQKLEIITFREAGILKGEIGWELVLLSQTAKLWMQRKSSWRKLKVLLQWTHKW